MTAEGEGAGAAGAALCPAAGAGEPGFAPRGHRRPLQISGDSFTLADITTPSAAAASRPRPRRRWEYGRIRVIFPDVPGIPEGFAQIRDIILDLIPCHLETEFYFRYITWQECEAQQFTWQMVEDGEHTWYSFELAV